MNATVLTISSREPHEPYYFLAQFRSSCAKHHVEPEFLQGLWRGLLSKPKLLKDHLNLGRVKTELVLFTDCWDIIFAAGLPSIIDKFKSFDAPIVFNAERSCFPRPDLAEQFPKSVTPYRFLNSGFFIGYTEAVASMLRDMQLDGLPDDFILPDGTKHEPNDQENYQVWYLANQTMAALDSQAFICQSLHSSEPDEFYFDHDKFASRVTGNHPAVFHGNGSGKAWLKNIIGVLGL